MSLPWTNRFAQRTANMNASEIREILKIINRPNLISFAGGVPDPTLFPQTEIAEAYQRILTDSATLSQALQYSISEGYLPLREWICQHMGQQGITLDPDNILITNGSQQGLEFVGKLLINPGDTLVVANPSYLGSFQAFSAYEPEYTGLPMDDEGISMAALEDALKTRPKFIYLVPDFQNPTGMTLSLARRQQLVDLAAQYEVPILEDCAYEQLRYEGESLPSLLTVDAQMRHNEHQGSYDGGVIYAGTFSKTIAPALRVGWIAAPKAVIQKLVLVKQASDLHSSTINQMVVHDVVSHHYAGQIQKLRHAYRERRDAMLSALDRYGSTEMNWTYPMGGMFIWLDLPQHIDATQLLQTSLDEANVAFVPGSPFFADRTSGKNTCRLSFSTPKPDAIHMGIERLSALIERAA